MKKTPFTPKQFKPAASRQQKGVVLIFCLIAIVIIFIASSALVRSFNTTLFNAGNLAFKRDLQNQGDQIVPQVLALFTTGGALSQENDRGADNINLNYSSSILPSNALGFPTALLGTDEDFTAKGIAANDVILAGQGITIRYLIDRLCRVGAGNKPTPSDCSVASNTPLGGSSSEISIPLPPTIVYRISMKVSGPRGTTTYFQTTFAI